MITAASVNLKSEVVIMEIRGRAYRRYRRYLAIIRKKGDRAGFYLSGFLWSDESLLLKKMAEITLLPDSVKSGRNETILKLNAEPDGIFFIVHHDFSF